MKMRAVLTFIFVSLVIQKTYAFDSLAYECRVFITDVSKIDNGIGPQHLEFRSLCGIYDGRENRPPRNKKEVLNQCNNFSSQALYFLSDRTRYDEFYRFNEQLKTSEFSFRKNPVRLYRYESASECEEAQRLYYENRIIKTNFSNTGFVSHVFLREEDDWDFETMFPVARDFSNRDYSKGKEFVNNSFRGIIYRIFTGKDLVP